MSRHKRNFHCFNAVGGEGSHKSSHPLDHHTTWLPKIPQRGMAAYHELEQECCLCPACRPAHTLDDVENQLLPFYHAHPPYYHHHHPHQYVLSGPSRHEETHSANDCHLHHQRYNKKIVLVKNSDPSFRKTVILHRRGLRSFDLFLEEVSELMQYHIRKLYTQEGCKIDSVQSLLQCPGVLVCVGREPFHPLVMEDFEKTSSCKLPKLSGKSCPAERTDGNESKRNNLCLFTEQYLDPICVKLKVEELFSVPDIFSFYYLLDSMSSKASDSLTFGK
ncbi:PREDICTED: retinitis pigmentosa 1-like 1 protein [Poecilia mexicana]|uniref:retinitis pigmentosa 1-like 1 protein n=1 Tax=Poecilia mexicana TaxID=48701 RepID=UPI00072E5276|nr:PREDICTED: retinitis pigmentosa 1-like 1 protein [Poecilia mexicana]